MPFCFTSYSSSICHAQYLHLKMLQARTFTQQCSNVARSKRLPFHIKSAEQHEVYFCTYTTCKNQGSRQICQFVRDLGLSGLEVRERGCMGNCGNGPNVMLRSKGENTSVQRLPHMSTPSQIAKVLKACCDVNIDESILKATECRLAGNAAARRGDLHGAVEHFDKGLEAAPPWGQHLLLSNRSGVKLALGDAEGALQDALNAAHCAPSTFSTAAVRQVEALMMMDKICEANKTLDEIGERWPDFKSSEEYQALSLKLQEGSTT